jgi:hypothetical protein
MENNKKKRNHHPTATPTIVPTKEIKIPSTYKPSNSLHEDSLPAPVPLINISSDPLPVPIPPMNISSDPLPVPVPPMNSTLNMIATSVSDTSSTSLVYLPLVLLSGLLGIGFITYKRYKKRFAYTRIPENDTFDI